MYNKDSSFFHPKSKNYSKIQKLQLQGCGYVNCIKNDPEITEDYPNNLENQSHPCKPGSAHAVLNHVAGII